MRASIIISAVFLGCAAAAPAPQAAAAQCFDAGDCILSVSDRLIQKVASITH